MAYWLPRGLGTAHAEQTWTRLNPKRPPAAQHPSPVASVVVIRTIPAGWVGVLRSWRQAGVNVVLLLDDALLEPGAIGELPFRYRWRLWHGITRHRHHLDTLISELWVTQDSLARSCQRQLCGQPALPIHCLSLRPPRLVVEPKPMHRVAYLGTASHRAELVWLLPLLEQLQRERNDCLLELVLPPQWRRRFRHIPRTRIAYPMDWDTYLADTSQRRVDLLLVPLLPSQFNGGRSAVKWFEAARLQAVGLYSQREPYSSLVQHNHDGLLLPDQQGAWLKAMHQLLDDQTTRERLRQACRTRALSLCSG